MSGIQAGVEVPEGSLWFRRDYKLSRQLFLETASRLSGFRTESVAWPIAEFEDCVTDTLWVGSEDARRVVVAISGTHGVEGFCGSAVQSYLLHCLQHRYLELEADTAFLLIHSLNPWGMQWARRCDQQGIDLNRNFVDFSVLPEAEPRYTQVLECLEFECADDRQKALDQLAQQWGQQTFERIFSGGQYTHCWAPFYGGGEPAFASELIDTLIEHYDLSQRQLTVIDLHSGLGPRGYGELISDHQPGSQGHALSRQCFGPAVASTALGESFSVVKSGLLDYRWHSLMADSGCFVTLEFGTYGTQALFDVLLGEHLFWRDYGGECQTEPHNPEYQYWRNAMLEHFCPQNPYWQQAVLFKAWQVFHCALKGVVL